MYTILTLSLLWHISRNNYSQREIREAKIMNIYINDLDEDICFAGNLQHNAQKSEHCYDERSSDKESDLVKELDLSETPNALDYDDEDFDDAVNKSETNKFRDAASIYMREVPASLLKWDDEIYIMQHIEFNKNCALALALLIPTVADTFKYHQQKPKKGEDSQSSKITKFGNAIGEDKIGKMKKSQLTVEIQNRIDNCLGAAKKLAKKLTVTDVIKLHEILKSLSPEEIFKIKGELSFKTPLKNTPVKIVPSATDANFFDFENICKKRFKRCRKDLQDYILAFMSLVQFNIDFELTKSCLNCIDDMSSLIKDARIKFGNVARQHSIEMNIARTHWDQCVASGEFANIAGENRTLRTKLLYINHTITELQKSSGCDIDVLSKIISLISTPKKEIAALTERMVVMNLRLVIHRTKKYNHRLIEFLDFVQEGNIGLLRAVEKFDYRKGFKFSTYATCWIRQGITRCIYEQGSPIRIPAHMQDIIRKIDRFSKEFVATHKVAPTETQISDGLGIAVEKINLALRSQKAPISLETPSSQEDDSNAALLISLIEYDDESTTSMCPSTFHEIDDMKVYLETLLETLSPRMAQILKLRFGIDCPTERTLEETGIQFGVTRERIRQLETKGIRTLKQATKLQTLQSILPLNK